MITLRPLVSIVIPAYNSQQWIGQTVESVITQTLTSWELVVIDDGSQDDTKEVVQRYVDRDSRIRLVRQANAGISAARNRGYAESSYSSEYLIFLDHDDLWESETLALLTAMLRSSPLAVAAYGLARTINSEGRLSSPGELERWTRNRKGIVDTRSGPWPPGQPTTFAVLVLGNCITTTGQVLIRRMALAGRDPFDRSTSPAEDWDLWLRLASKGTLPLIDVPVIRYRTHGDNASRDRRAMARGERRVRQKLAASRTLDRNQRTLTQLGEHWGAWEMSQLRWRWAKESFAQGNVLLAAVQLRHWFLERARFQFS
jgi:glycosyltransferase involved in cell wall biosynthesis